ncbi:uncharacterized protein LOC126963305 [Macaca thibetana thibetana]|uniref:uncharacterized protein LOC126963305 n=1 Tax=Macaca thibetana thibetana TaxID=257877 RepID=UPI0021BC4E9D|nr:uncharacterized protein LOC126963305 [Macaca thibetana thibetana]XP_050661490.1 uncharacterized protein LOC126963305 [Macaca thibetana thibetana]XP_050661491.1 uncharacterized protein LOC126963305 [Macaca thibetana thibetana]XP_050661492.1 uncharacterized protein LOC126963305 [Macaca thibetana thibetana]XP_050661493.1 uncharacterized protein LOC126963305 [Macaca thibetana thibetana]
MPNEIADQLSSVHVTAKCIMAMRSLLDPAAAHQGMWPGAREQRGPEDRAPCQAHRFCHLLASLWRQRRCLLCPRPTCKRRGTALRPPRVSFIPVPQTEGPCHLLASLGAPIWVVARMQGWEAHGYPTALGSPTEVWHSGMCTCVCVPHLPPVPGGGSTCPCSSLWACPLPSQTQQRQEAEATMASVHGAQACQPASLFRSLNALLEVCSVRGQLCHPQGETLFSGEVSMWPASRGAGPSPWPAVCCTRPRSRSCTASRELPMLWGRHQTRDGLTGPRELTQGPRGLRTGTWPELLARLALSRPRT